MLISLIVVALFSLLAALAIIIRNNHQDQVRQSAYLAIRQEVRRADAAIQQQMQQTVQQLFDAARWHE